MIYKDALNAVCDIAQVQKIIGLKIDVEICLHEQLQGGFLVCDLYLNYLVK